MIDPFDPVSVRAFQINDLMHAHQLSCDGTNEVLYEDDYVIVECKDGKCLMTGKPFRSPFMYSEVKGLS